MRKCCCSILPEPGLRRREARRPLFSREASVLALFERRSSWAARRREIVRAQGRNRRKTGNTSGTDLAYAVFPGFIPCLVRTGSARPHGIALKKAEEITRECAGIRA